jgi:quercetin dioxygenase-like cupin family protein
MAMKVVTLKDIPIVPAEGAAERIEGWTGPVARTRQTIIEPGESANYNRSVVNFSQGCTTGWHTHDCDQVLIVTTGSGMVATEHEQHEINVGGCRAGQGR